MGGEEATTFSLPLNPAGGEVRASSSSLGDRGVGGFPWQQRRWWWRRWRGHPPHHQMMVAVVEKAGIEDEVMAGGVKGVDSFRS
jgi:hypothetical protein